MVATSHASVAIEPMPGVRVLVVEARYYQEMADALLAGAKAALQAARVDFDVLTVHGALETPTMVVMALDAAKAQGQPYDAAVVLGTVIRGDTTHYDIVSEESCRGLMQISIERAFPIGNGILTVENEEQAWDRALPEKQDKGGGAVRAALIVLANRQAVMRGRV